MGNCLFLCVPSKRKILWVEKMDGKMIQFQGPILVKDVLANFSGLGVGVSRESPQNLPSDYELKSGKVYHLLPSSVSSGDSSSSSVGATEVSSMADDGEKKKTTTTTSGMTRIKVVITKQQLQELLSKKTSLEELLLSQSVFPSSPGNWKPKLDPIPEGIE